MTISLRRRLARRCDVTAIIAGLPQPAAAPADAPAPARHRALAAVSLALLASAFLGWVACVVVGLVAHEPWFDEAQAWLLARDASLGELLFHRLRYEGHPPLWYLLLAVPAKLGLPYKTINLVSAAIAGVGVVLLLAERRLPLAVRCGEAERESYVLYRRVLPPVALPAR